MCARVCLCVICECQIKQVQKASGLLFCESSARLSSALLCNGAGWGPVTVCLQSQFTERATVERASHLLLLIIHVKRLRFFIELQRIKVSCRLLNKRKLFSSPAHRDGNRTREDVNKYCEERQKNLGRLLSQGVPFYFDWAPFYCVAVEKGNSVANYQYISTVRSIYICLKLKAVVLFKEHFLHGDLIYLQMTSMYSWCKNKCYSERVRCYVSWSRNELNYRLCFVNHSVLFNRVSTLER